MNYSISIITDDIVFSNLLIPLLKRELPDVKIQICNSYQEINNHFSYSSCDFILIDGGISSISSIEIIQYLRTVKRIIAPIWFFPEITTNEYIYKSIQMGASKIINKPFNPFLIIDEIALSYQTKQLNMN
jgi:DNA-binding response OmpR family regulator